MAQPARVLLIGKTRGPLETMARVLRYFWLVQMSVVNDGDRPPLEAEVVVLCDTFTERERQAWVDQVKGGAPAALIVKMNGYDSGPHAGADATVDEQQGPGALVSTIYEMLRERGLGSRGWRDEAEVSWLQ